MSIASYPGPGVWPAEFTEDGIVPAFDVKAARAMTIDDELSVRAWERSGSRPASAVAIGVDERLSRIREGAARADAELATWLLADPDRANNAAIVVMFATAMIRAAAAEPGEMLAKLYTFNAMLGAVVEYVETGHSSWEGSPWDALAALVR